MKFILNTAVDPHFCALFDESGNLIERREWTNRRRDGAEIFEFLNTYLINPGVKNSKTPGLSFIGGVTGPGGFSSLRAGAGVLNALSVAHKLPIHQVRSDIWIGAFLAEHNQNPEAFVLNSFSEGVFIPEKGELVRMDATQAVQKIKTPILTALLPEAKQNLFLQKIDIPFEKTETTLLAVLQKASPQEMFLPDYEFPPV